MATKKRVRTVVGVTFPEGRVAAGQLVPESYNVPDDLIERGKAVWVVKKAGKWVEESE